MPVRQHVHLDRPAGGERHEHGEVLAADEHPLGLGLELQDVAHERRARRTAIEASRFLVRGRDVGVGVDLPVRVVQGDADLRPPVLEHVHLPHAGYPRQRGGPVGPRLDDGPRPGHAEVRPGPGVLRAEADDLAAAVPGQRPAEPDGVEVGVGWARPARGSAWPERRRLVLEHGDVVVVRDLGQVPRRRRGERVELGGRQERPVLPRRRDRDPLAGQRVLPQRRAARAAARAAARRPRARAAATCPRRRSRSAPGRRSAW